MSIEQIAKYIKSTPGNTNPNVVNSMVAAENRKAVYEEVQVLKDTGAVGDWELREIFSLKIPQEVKDEWDIEEPFGDVLEHSNFLLSSEENYLVKLEWGEYYCSCKSTLYQGMPVKYITNMSSLSEDLYELDQKSFIFLEMEIQYGGQNYSMALFLFGRPTDFSVCLQKAKPLSPSFIGNLLKREKEENILFDENFQILGDFSEFEGANGTIFFAGIGLQLGKKYLVKTSSLREDVECICKLGFFEGIGVYYLGNLGLFVENFPNSGETFLVVDGIPVEGVKVGIFLDFSGGERGSIKLSDEIYNINYEKFNGRMGNSQTVDKAIIEWDGEPIGQSYFESNFNHGSSWTYRYLDYPIDPNSITSLTWSVTEGLYYQMDFIIEECSDSKNRKYFIIKRPESTFNLIYISDEGFSIANKAGTVVEVPRGTYVCKNMDGWVSKVIAKVEEISKIDRKYLPEGVGYDVTEPAVLGKDYYVSDLNDHVDINHGGRIFYSLAAPKMDASKITGIKAQTLLNGVITYGPEDFEIKTEQDKNGVSYTAIYAGDYYYAYVLILDQSTTFVGSKNNSYTKEDILLPPGVYVLLDYNNGYKVKELHSGIITKNIPIKQEYIPTMDSVTLKGENGKLYKLYIDSTGVLKTQEI